MSRLFDWTRMNTDFMRHVILASSRAKEFEPKLSKCTEEDVDRIAGMMNMICPEPDTKFTMRFRKIIERDLLYRYPEICEDILREERIPRGPMNERLAALYDKRMSEPMAGYYVHALYQINGWNAPINEYSKFKYIVSVDMEKTEKEDVPLYDFQKEACERMKQHFLEKGNRAGMLIMPTGSGKSRTATTFLIKELVSRGYQILWLAHRHMLIDQAADCFEKFAGLAKSNDSKIKKYRISCISGEHQSIKAVGESEIIVATVNSLYRNKPHLKRLLKNKLMVVVDEAHHTPAPTYDDILCFIRKTKRDVKLLGLTATPVRMNDNDTRYLMKQFDNTIIYSVPMSNLISSGVLADPQFKKVETLQEFEPIISEDEKRLLEHYKELPESLVGKIAASHARNEVILNEYFGHSAEYGKTLIFAMNKMHCQFLVEELRANGVKCGGVWSGKEGNSATIDNFKEGKLDVLVNVNIMTEGTDVPDIQTVFLTRPTQSDAFLMQMIGRGLRGTQAGGTSTANIVDFHDKWETFNKWLDPQWIIEGEADKPLYVTEKKTYDYQEYDWKLCREAYNSLRNHFFDVQEMVTIPCGWFTLIDECGEIVRMLVFDSQLDGINELISDCDSWTMDLSIDPKVLRNQYFPGMGYRPSVREIELLVDNVLHRESLPKMIPIEGREIVDPVNVSKRAREEGREVSALAKEIFDANPLAEDLFGDRDKYIEAVWRARENEDKVPIGSKVEELPYELIPFDRTPCYDVKELMAEVIREQFDGTYPGISGITWTPRPCRSYYGVFYPDDNSIKINCLLNSKSVPREVVKFVIYHELLHRDHPKHDTAFRAKEHKYPDYVGCEEFLYGKMRQFDIKEL